MIPIILLVVAIVALVGFGLLLRLFEAMREMNGDKPK